MQAVQLRAQRITGADNKIDTFVQMTYARRLVVASIQLALPPFKHWILPGKYKA